MACEITRPDPQILFDRMRDMFSTTVLQGAKVIPESNEWYVVSLNYAVAEEFYAYSEQQWKEQDPRTACCENLKTIAARDGVFPYASTFAQGYIELSGNPGAALPDSITVTIGGSQYVSEGAVDNFMPVSGRSIVRVRSQTPGTQDNGTVGTTGTLNAIIPGVNQTVRVFGGFCGGEDAETCEQFRSRYLARKQFAPRATASWIEQKFLEWPCVTRVCRREGSCCEVGPDGISGCDCGGEFNYYVFMDNTFDCGIPPQCVIDQINEWMFGPMESKGYGLGQVEVGVCGQVYPMEGVEIGVRISDYGCITNAQKNEIRVNMAEFFRTLCPSTEINQNQIGAVVGTVLGFETNYVVELTYPDDAPVNEYGDPSGVGCRTIELLCDKVACLGEIVFQDTFPEQGAC